jgi:hypothetical protein
LSLVLREESGAREFENEVLRIINPHKRKKERQEQGEEENYRVRDLWHKRTMVME